MLTVKHVDANSETVFECDSVVHATSSPKPTVICHSPKTQTDLTCGVVYVMNESGKTVATYNLPRKTENLDDIRARGMKDSAALFAE